MMTKLENTIAEAWRHVLGVECVDQSSDFFDLGGDSLAAMNMLHVLSQKLVLELDHGTLFENPKFSDFVAAIRAI